MKATKATNKTLNSMLNAFVNGREQYGLRADVFMSIDDASGSASVAIIPCKSETAIALEYFVNIQVSDEKIEISVINTDFKADDIVYTFHKKDDKWVGEYDNRDPEQVCWDLMYETQVWSIASQVWKDVTGRTPTMSGKQIHAALSAITGMINCFCQHGYYPMIQMSEEAATVAVPELEQVWEVRSCDNNPRKISFWVEDLDRVKNCFSFVEVGSWASNDMSDGREPSGVAYDIVSEYV